MTVRDLANQMAVSPIELIKGLMNAGIMANINQQIDYETAAIVAEDMGYKVIEFKAPEPVVVEEEKKAEPTVQRRVYTEEEKKHLRERPPVVTILGHVDHGKTSLLDAVRTTNVTAGEVGGITQHIGAYQVEAQNKPITFLDTPGHAAFTAMRARGASVTDIVVLVVAADDGVQPQTREAIDHAHAAKVPIIVALNKIDVPSANPDRVKQQLSDVGLVPEEWGGDTVVVPVSAKQKLGISALLDMILLVAEMADLRADPRLPAQGTVIEGKLDRSRGPMVTLLVQDGTLKVGDAVLVGHTYGKIRAMFDQQGKPLKRALPASPAVITGLREVPAAGDHFEIVESEREAREKAEQRLLGDQAAKAQPAQVLTLDEIYQRAQEGSAVALNLILKADVDGSMEPIKNSLEKLEVGKLKVKFVHLGVGTVSESDVMLAVASQAVIIGFGVSVEPSAQRLAETEGISIRSYNIIYRIVEDIQLALTGMLEPEIKEVVQGQAIVRNVFNIPRQGKIAGAQVTEGKALRNGLVRVKRNNAVIHEGKVGSLKRFTEDVREVTAGMECGVGIDGFATVQVDDVLEFYTKEKSKPSE
jgi:translation initiation factor IF-2